MNAALPAEAAAGVRLPAPDDLFRRRAERLDALASDHAAADWLRFLARLARGQDRAAREVRAPAGPRAGSGPPLAAAFAVRDPAWRAMLRVVLVEARGGPLPSPAAAAVARLLAAAPSGLEALADEVPGGAPADLAAAPFVGAALQVYLASLAAGLDPASIAPGAGGCPVCGGAPVASVVLGDDRARRVVCGVCGSDWRRPRVQCALCEEPGGLSYLGLEDGPRGVAAECCDGCRTYLKIFDLAELPRAEAVADDAASLVLDLLVGERGFRRAGVNPLAPGGERG